MKEAVKIKTENSVARFFEQIMIDKQAKNKEINRKIKNGEIKVAN